jgi:hypothetical protein
MNVFVVLPPLAHRCELFFIASSNVVLFPLDAEREAQKMYSNTLALMLIYLELFKSPGNFRVKRRRCVWVESRRGDANRIVAGLLVSSSRPHSQSKSLP